MPSMYAKYQVSQKRVQPTATTPVDEGLMSNVLLDHCYVSDWTIPK